MALQSTTLSNLLSRMNRYQSVSTIEETYKVRDLDEAMRTLRRTIQPPWVIKETTIMLFKDVYIYPAASDHSYLAMIERDLNDGKAPGFKPDMNARYTSLKQFYQDQDGRNLISEVWDGGNRFLGIRYKDINGTSALVSTNTASNYTASGDASSPTAETVETVDGLDTVKFTVTLSASSATMTEAMPSLSDTDYLKKYYFRWVYLDAVPTSVQLRFGNDSSNYLSKTVTTQFGGQGFQVDRWNLLAFDLNTATTTGTITSTAFDYAAMIMSGAATGTYYIGPAYLRGWKKLDYYYYSRYNIKTSASSVLNREYFFNSSDEYDISDSLVGEPEWIDVILFDALLTSLADQKNSDVVNLIAEKRKEAWTQLEMKYPDMAEIIVTQKYNFGNEPGLDLLKDR